MNQSLTFTLTTNPIEPREQEIFEADLKSLGFDANIWPILNGSVATRTSVSIPKVLRAYEDDRLVGVAYIVECHRFGASLFEQKWLVAIADLLSTPAFYWMRLDVLLDAISNPGFVSPELDRDVFFNEAIAYLNRQYLLGMALEEAWMKPAANCTSASMADNGRIEVDSSTLEQFFSKHKKLKRKVNTFKIKGGTIEIIEGPISEQVWSDLERCMGTLKPLFLMPFQDNFPSMMQKLVYLIR